MSTGGGPGGLTGAGLPATVRGDSLSFTRLAGAGLPATVRGDWLWLAADQTPNTLGEWARLKLAGGPRRRRQVTTDPPVRSISD